MPISPDQDIDAREANGSEDPTISVVMIAKDEASRIGAALESVRFATEVIVADTGSSDGTAFIATEFGAKVIQLPFNGFGPTKQAALEHAHGDWVLSLDADEVVSVGLALEILKTTRAPESLDGYWLPRRAWFLGKRIEHGGWGKDEVVRLFRREKGRFTEDIVHEQVVVEGKLGRLAHILEHHTDPSFPRYLAKLDRYSTLAAEKIAANTSKRTGVGPALAHAFSTFLRIYATRGGWREGLHGALLAASSTYASFLRYIKADLIRRGQGEVFTATQLREIPRSPLSTPTDPDNHDPENGTKE